MSQQNTDGHVVTFALDTSRGKAVAELSSDDKVNMALFMDALTIPNVSTR